MKPFWYPISALRFADTGFFTSAFLLRRLLARSERVDLLYAGDRMWPAIRDGQLLRVRPLGERPLMKGAAVVAAIDGVPEIVRVAESGGDQVGVCCDADPAGIVLIGKKDILGGVDLRPRRHGMLARTARRLLLDAREALGGELDPSLGAAETVRLKYDSQAAYYLRGAEDDLPASLLEIVRRNVPPGGRILVAGSGVGRECFALSLQGWEAEGIDFSPNMVELARQEALRRALTVPFHLVDLRGHDEERSSLDAVLFTFDVYSFIPTAAERISLLSRMAAWLKPDGAVLLSARRVRGAYDRWILFLQSLASVARGAARWGESHSRWIDAGGTLHRSFVRVFTERSLRREIERAGFQAAAWESGHLVIKPGRTSR